MSKDDRKDPDPDMPDGEPSAEAEELSSFINFLEEEMADVGITRVPRPQRLPDGDLDITGQGHYTLDEEHTAVPATRLLEWARWYEDTPRRVVKQELIGSYFISTVFLGLDHSFGRILRFSPLQGLPSDHPLAEMFAAQHRPILFETMVFLRVGRDEKLEVQDRCSTWDEAVEMHNRIAAEFRRTLNG